MLNNNNDSTVFILSAELSTNSFRTNSERTAELSELLQASGMPFKDVLGRYEGTDEVAFVVVTEDRERILKLARDFDQECILELGPKNCLNVRESKLLGVKTGEVYATGEFIIVPEYIAKENKSYTFDGKNYYIIK